MAPIVFIIPVLAIVVVNYFKYLIGEFRLIALALELHVSGLIQMTPLLLFRPNMIEPLLSIVTVSHLTLVLTSTLYMKSTYNPNNASYEKVAVFIGAIFFITGITLTALLS